MTETSSFSFVQSLSLKISKSNVEMPLSSLTASESRCKCSTKLNFSCSSLSFYPYKVFFFLNLGVGVSATVFFCLLCIHPTTSDPPPPYTSISSASYSLFYDIIFMQKFKSAMIFISSESKLSLKSVKISTTFSTVDLISNSLIILFFYRSLFCLS